MLILREVIIKLLILLEVSLRVGGWVAGLNKVITLASLESINKSKCNKWLAILLLITYESGGNN